jgi:DNA-binding transcriptional ArsR family regulator
VREDGQRRLYSLDPEPLAELDEWLARYRRFWTNRLEALDTEIRRRGRRR